MVDTLKNSWGKPRCTFTSSVIYAVLIELSQENTWLMGQFNICIIVSVCHSGGTTSTMIFRCHMPHKFGEQYSPGAVDEKMRAEVATYA